jgi:hypothetical protein
MRILYSNIIDDIDDTSITATTENASYPVENIKDDRLAVKYKSDASTTTNSILVELPTYPIFPDGAATYFRNKDWTVTTGWAGGTGSTLSIENASLKVVTTAGNQSNAASASAAYQNKSIRLIIKSDTPITSIYTVIGSTVFTAMALTPMGGGRYMADIQWSRTGNDNFAIFPNYPATTAITWYLESIYIGTGAYTIPIPDSAGLNPLTNNGLLPVQSPFGLALRASGAQYAECDNPVFGTTGTISLYFRRAVLGTTQYITHNSSSFSDGFLLSFNTSNIFRIGLSNGSSIVGYGTKVFNDTTAWHSANICTNGKVYYDGVLSSDVVSTTWIAGVSKLIIGYYGSAYFSGDIIVRVDNRVWSAADVASWHNDPSSVPMDNTTLLNIDLDSEYKVNSLAILGHNIKTPNIKVEANSVNDFTSPPLSETISYNKDVMLKFLSSKYIYKYWKFTFTNQAAIEIGRIWLGTYTTIDPSSLLDFTVTKKNDDIITHGRGRQKFANIGETWRLFKFSFPPTKYNTINLLEKMIAEIRSYKSVIFCNFDTNRDYEIVEPCYCSLNGETAFKHNKNMKFNYELELEEEL